MIFNFIFNDCIPDNMSLNDYANALHNTLLAYKEMEKPRDFDPFGHAGLSPLVTI